jgi:quercetin dioxygenase-like cupin family protein
VQCNVESFVGEGLGFCVIFGDCGKGGTMKALRWMTMISGCVLAAGALIAADQQGKGKPLTFLLECAGGDCPLLKGAPQTSGMRGGSVRLKPGESVGWHSTNDNEEALTILRGDGVANIEGHADVPLHEKMLAYIPPGIRHNVTNTGNEVLEYVWVVAPVRK